MNVVVLAPGVELRSTGPLPASAYPVVAWLADYFQQRKAVAR